MTTSTTNPKVDAFLDRAGAWQDEIVKLRAIALDCGLTEELKWGKPCYTFGKTNIAIIQPFNDTCDLMFFKGALLKDPKGLLEIRGPNSQAARQFQFTGLRQISDLEPTVKAYIQEAIENEKAGLKVDYKSEVEIPAELQDMFAERPDLQTAFNSLTPGRQRGYILHFTAAKQSKTRTARIEKAIPAILEGKGLQD